EVTEIVEEDIPVRRDVDEIVATLDTDAALLAIVEEVAAAEEADPAMAAKIAEEMMATERIRRDALDRYADAMVKQGKTDKERGNYDEAIKSFELAQDTLGLRAANKARRDEVETLTRDTYYLMALDLRKNGALVPARDAAVHAKALGHAKAESLVSAIDADLQKPAPTTTKSDVPLRSDPKYAEYRQSVELMRKRALDYYASGEYDLCRQQLELIMKDNPYEESAINLLRRLENARRNVAQKEAESTRAKMMYEVSTKWTAARYGLDTAGGEAIIGPTNDKTDQIPVFGEIQRKMKSITIPEIDFRNANLTDVITFLGDMSREHDDPTLPEEKRGINLILSLGSGATTPAAAAKSAASPFDFAPAAAESNDPASKPITIQARYLSLEEALQLVMEMANLKYIIRGNIVMVVPFNYDSGELKLKTYNVLPTILERNTSAASTSNADTWGANTIQRIDGGGGAGAAMDWKEFFGEYGVNWPPNSSVQYMSNISRLVVKNTDENIAILETVLGFLNVTPKQVEIEARFVEVLQTDTESLGFEWILNQDYSITRDRNGRGTFGLDSNTYQNQFGVRAGAMTGGFNYLTREDRYRKGDRIGIPENIMTISGIIGNALDLDVILHILSQKQNADLLSAPKVVTQNGKQATIKVVREYIYPTEYTTDPVMSSGSGTGANSVQIGAVVTPGSFAMREVGVILTVTPDVSTDGQLINLSMTPAVVDEPTWEEYGSMIPMYIPDANGVMQLLLDPNTRMPVYTQISMRQPIFPVRSIDTRIQIYNGSTVVMGGMITEGRDSVEEKIPILGDIPLLGRFFRNTYERSVKRNLLIFVTARLVTPDGVPVMMDSQMEISQARSFNTVAR
ncbi:MAG: hypothetical protein FWF84_07315, partial [Kiritimatiellaeota bacterium]|nr:hypothetical protein [Kiritimatiellota bacterium]